MYENSNVKSSTQFWLLHDLDHYDSINNIKRFLAVEYFCPHCLQGFHHKKAFDSHKCNDSEDEVFSKKKKKQVKSSKIGKDITHYLHRQYMKGGNDEVDGKTEQLKRRLIKANEDPNSE